MLWSPSQDSHILPPLFRSFLIHLFVSQRNQRACSGILERVHNNSTQVSSKPRNPEEPYTEWTCLCRGHVFISYLCFEWQFVVERPGRQKILSYVLWLPLPITGGWSSPLLLTSIPLSGLGSDFTPAGRPFGLSKFSLTALRQPSTHPSTSGLCTCLSLHWRVGPCGRAPSYFCCVLV